MWVWFLKMLLGLHTRVFVPFGYWYFLNAMSFGPNGRPVEIKTYPGTDAIRSQCNPVHTLFLIPLKPSLRDLRQVSNPTESNQFLKQACVRQAESFS